MKQMLKSNASFELFFRHQTVLVCLIIWLFAAGIRGFYFSRNVVFTQDQARDVILMDKIVTNSEWLIGYGPKVSVSDFRLPPLYYYIHAVVYALNDWPPMMSVVILLIESATPVLLYLLFLRNFTQFSGVIAALLHSAAHIPVYYSTFMWNPNLIPFFSTLALFAAFEYFRSQQIRWFTIISFSLMMSINLHYQAFVLLPFYVLFCMFFFFKRPKHRLGILFSTVATSIFFIPYILVEMMNNWVNTRQIWLFFTAEHTQYFDRVSKPAYILQFLPQFFGRVLISESIKLTDTLLIGRVLLLLLFSSLILSIKKLFQHKTSTFPQLKTILLIFYLLIVILSTRLYKGDKLDYYLSVLYIFPALILGISASILPIKKLLFLLVSAFLLLNGVYFRQVSVRPQNGYLDILNVFLEIEAASNGKKTVIVTSHPDLKQQVLFGLQQTSIEIAPPGSKPDVVVHLCTVDVYCDALPRFFSKYSTTVENLELQVEYTVTQEYKFVRSNQVGQYSYVVTQHQ